jgi:thiamine biosynthesis protein ThiS
LTLFWPKMQDRDESNCAHFAAGAVESRAMTDKIEITLNGFSEKIPQGATPSQLIAGRGDGDVHLIAEVNGRFVYPHDYSEKILSNGDRVELINPNFGG